MKNYVIIGGSSGIGKALTKQLAFDGNLVTATYNQSAIEPMDGVTYHHLNILDDQPDFSFLPQVIDGFAYCPGSIDLKPFARMKPESFVEDFNLQVVGAIKTIQAALPGLKKANQSSIVLFSTVAVQTGFPFHSKVAASKGAIEGLARALAAEFAPTIRVNCIAPSITDTPLAASLLSSDEKKEANANRHPLKRIGQADDVASLASYLMSSPSPWITGQILHVDGGISSIRI